MTFTEKLLIEATLEVLEKGLVVGLQDMGAAGLTSSSFEMAGRAGNGLYMDLDHVPVRTTNMTAYELLLSESQERMLMVIEPHQWEPLKQVLDKWELHCNAIGVVTDTGRVQIHHQGKLEIDVPVNPMTDAAPKYERPMQARTLSTDAESKAFDVEVAQTIKTKGPDQVLLGILKDTGDKSPVYRQYDHHIGTKTVHGPSEQGAAVLWVRSDWADPSEPHLGVLTAASCNERYCRVDPRQGAAHAVLKSARAIAAAGGRPLAITDCLNYGNPEDPLVMSDFSLGVDGISDACRELSVPVVSGNVSLYNTTDGKSIAPTPMIGMVGKMTDVRPSPPAIIRAATTLYLLHPKKTAPAFGGSLVGKLLGMPLDKGQMPRIQWPAEREAMEFLRRHVAKGAITAARDVGDGGIAATACRMVIGTQLGLSLDLTHADLTSDQAVYRYFGEVSGCYLVAIKDDVERVTVAEAGRLDKNLFIKVGQVTSSGEYEFGGWSLQRERALQAFRASI